MRRLLLVLSTLLLAGSLLGPAGASSAAPPLPGVSFTSDNVEHIGHLAEVGPTVSARVVTVEGQRRLYVSSIARGLSIYDIDDPTSPELIGALPIGGFQNEDMAVAPDGSLAVLAYGDTNQYTFNLVIDTSDPTLPVLLSRTSGGDHTAECVTDDCSWLYGSEGNIYDLSDPANPRTLPTTWIRHARDQGVNVTGFPHKVVLDDAGYVITDSSPRVVFDITDPANPVVVSSAETPPASANIRYQHNNLRPRAEQHVPRTPGDDDAALRAGELMLAAGETNLTGTCDGAGGPFMTWSMRDFDKGEPMTLIETFRPLANGTYSDSNPAVNALGCSAHWFDWTDDGDDYLVAAGWFEHGARLLTVEAETGAIDEVGFFQPVNGSVSSAYWIDDEHVYTTDYVRGIDILKVDRDPESRPSQDELDASWIASLDRPTLPQTQLEQAICRIPGLSPAAFAPQVGALLR
jgi:hypothetical protein